MTALDPHIFRAYDIRGKAGSQITPDACRLVGHAFGTTVVRLYKKDHPTIVVGRDARTHSKDFEAAAIEGLQSAGCEVLLMGQTPSPLNYFTICNEDLDGGLQITASHNPASDNGIKLQVREAEAFSGEELQKLRKQIDNNDMTLAKAPPSKNIDATVAYRKRLKAMFGNIGNELRIVIDGGNGVAGPLYSDVLQATGAEIEGLYLEPDGTFPNHPADPSKQETLKDLQARVKSTKADFGLAFDGDGDRLGLVDETGTIRNSDDILLLLSEDVLTRHAGATVVFTVSNSGVLETEIPRLGGKAIMCKVGHSFVEHAMREHKALLGGEQSGHFFCSEDYYGFDDALVAALRVVKIAGEKKKPLSSLFAAFPKVYQAPERRPHCPDEKKDDVIARITAHFQNDYPVNTLDGARIDFGEGAWAGIRKSNTSPCISICLEARSPAKLAEIEELVFAHLQGYSELSLEANH